MKKSSLENFAEAIKDVAVQANIKSVHPQTFYNIAKCKKAPSLSTVDKVCDELNIQRPFFYDGDLDKLLRYVDEISKGQGYKLTVVIENGK